MNSQNNLQTGAEEIITINGRSSLDYWCDRFSVTPFTLFHLLRTVGNNATEIGEILHKHSIERLEKGQAAKILTKSNLTIL